MANGKDGVGISPTAAAIGGALAGAAVVAAIALSDRDNRQKVNKKIGDLKKQGQKKLATFRDKAEDVRDDAGKKLESVEQKTRKQLTRARS